MGWAIVFPPFIKSPIHLVIIYGSDEGGRNLVITLVLGRRFGITLAFGEVELKYESES